MNVICNWYHKDERLIRVKPGEGISHSLCAECRQRFEKEVDHYVERLRKHSAKTEESVVSGR